MRALFKWYANQMFYKKQALKTLAIIVCISFFAPVICNETPLILKTELGCSSPLFSKWFYGTLPQNCSSVYVNNTWQYQHAIFVLLPPIPYSANFYDYNNAPFISPFQKQSDGLNNTELSWRYRHWLGTGKKGEDVLACCIYGLANSIFISGAATLLAALIAFVLGITSGFFGNNYFKLSWLHYLGLVGGFLSGYYFMVLLFPLWFDFNNLIFAGAFIAIWLIVFLVFSQLAKRFSVSGSLNFPYARIIHFFVNIFSAIPALILIVVVIAWLKPTVTTLIILLAITGWPTLMRIAYIETKQIMTKPYMLTATAMGYSADYIIRKEILPNFSNAFATTTIYVFAALLVAESSLTFLGLGTPYPFVTLGSLLGQFNENFEAWWIAVFPTTLLFIVLFCLHTIAKSKTN
ncbi:MAG: ABC transporter permease [Bacteroidia bacterium]|nr:ABC transporter permease [Bacteroidia bacterium]